MSVVKGLINVPVFLNGDPSNPIGHANARDDGTIQIILAGPYGENVRRQIMTDATKAFGLSYAIMQAVPKAPVRETISHVVDGVDGLTPDMLRAPHAKEEHVTVCECGLEHITSQLKNDSTCICGKNLVFQALTQVTTDIIRIFKENYERHTKQ